MPKCVTEIAMMPLKAEVDPQGTAFSGAMNNLHLPGFAEQRNGKHLVSEVQTGGKSASLKKSEEMSGKLLGTRIMKYDGFRPSPLTNL